jgi:hypothetical protein
MQNDEHRGNELAVLTVREPAPFAGEAGLDPAGAQASAGVAIGRKKGAHGGNMVSPMPETMVIDGGQYFH